MPLTATKLAQTVDHGGPDELVDAIRALIADGPQPDPLFLEILRRRLLAVLAQQAGVCTTRGRAPQLEVPESWKPRRRRRRRLQ